MGLLSGLWNAVDPYLPDEQIMGLLGRRGAPQGLLGGDYMNLGPRAGIDPSYMPAQPAPPAAPPDRSTDGRVGFLDTLFEWDGGSWSGTKEKLRQAELSRPMTRQIQQDRLRAVSEAYGSDQLTPQQRLALGLNPEALGAAFAEGSKPRQSKIKDVNGFLIDENDPNNVGRFIPDLPEGAVPYYDAEGNVVAVRNLDGTVNTLAEQKAAVATAEASARAPFEFINVPTRTGAPEVRSKSTAAGGVFTGQSPLAAILERGAATAAVEQSAAAQNRASTAGAQLAALDEMESRLPDVISGFGAGMRLETARALAAVGNKDAQRQVEATETFINQARVLVAGIIKTFGANPTEGERKFAERMSGADAELNPETLREGIRLQRARIARDLAAAGKTSPGAPPSAQRQPGQVYQTPRGPMKWTGTGWLPQ